MKRQLAGSRRDEEQQRQMDQALIGHQRRRQLAIAADL
jgi:hypothetical protein